MLIQRVLDFPTRLKYLPFPYFRFVYCCVCVTLYISKVKGEQVVDLVGAVVIAFLSETAFLLSMVGRGKLILYRYCISLWTLILIQSTKKRCNEIC